MDAEVNNLIIEAKALEDVLVTLSEGFSTGVDLLSTSIKPKIIRLLDIQKMLKEDYNINYSSSLLYDFTQLQEVNVNGSNVQE